MPTGCGNIELKAGTDWEEPQTPRVWIQSTQLSEANGEKYGFGFSTLKNSSRTYIFDKVTSKYENIANTFGIKFVL